MDPVPIELIITKIQHDLMECMADGLKHYKILMDELISSTTKQPFKDSQLEEYHNKHLKIIKKALESSYAYEEIIKINDNNITIKIQQQMKKAKIKLVQLLDAEFKNIYLSRNEIQMDAVVAKIKSFTNQADISYDKSVEEVQPQAEISQSEIRNKHKTWKGEALLLFDGLLQENSFQIETFRKHELTCRLNGRLENLLLEYPDQQDSNRLQDDVARDEVSSTFQDPPAGANKSVAISDSTASLGLFSVPTPLVAFSTETLTAKILESRKHTAKALSTTSPGKVLSEEIYAPATLTSVTTNVQALSANKYSRQVPITFNTTTDLHNRSMADTGLKLPQTSASYDLRSASKELIKNSFKTAGHSDVRVLPNCLATPIQYSNNASKLPETVTLRSNLRLTIQMPQKEIVTTFKLQGNELVGRLVVFDEPVSVIFSNRSNETILLIRLDEFYGLPEQTFKKVCSYQVTVVADQLYPTNGIRNEKSLHILDGGRIQIMVRIQCVTDIDGVYTLSITESPAADPNVSIKMKVIRTDNHEYVLNGCQNISHNKFV